MSKRFNCIAPDEIKLFNEDRSDNAEAQIESLLQEWGEKELKKEWSPAMKGLLEAGNIYVLDSKVIGRAQDLIVSLSSADDNFGADIIASIMILLVLTQNIDGNTGYDEDAKCVLVFVELLANVTNCMCFTNPEVQALFDEAMGIFGPFMAAYQTCLEDYKYWCETWNTIPSKPVLVRQ